MIMGNLRGKKSKKASEAREIMHYFCQIFLCSIKLCSYFTMLITFEYDIGIVSLTISLWQSPLLVESEAAQIAVYVECSEFVTFKVPFQLGHCISSLDFGTEPQCLHQRMN